MFGTIVIICVAAVLYVFSQGNLSVREWVLLLSIPLIGVIVALPGFFKRK